MANVLAATNVASLKMHSSSREVLRKIDQVWSVLDDLAQNDPNAYKKFIENQMEGENLEPQLEFFSCLRTEIMEPKKGLLCINIYGSKRILAPPLPGKPTAMFAGILEVHKDKDGDECHVVDVALSPAVLHEARQDARHMEHLHRLVLRFAQQRCGLKLSQQYTATNSGLQASLEDAYRRIGFQQHRSRPAVSTTKPESVLLTPAALLKQMSSPRMEESQGAVTVGAVEQKSNTRIQVLSSTFTATPPQKPEHQLTVNPGAGVELTVALPKIRSISECQLSISQEDVLLVVEDLYHLLLELPIPVNEDSATAIFSKKTRMLTVTVAAL